MICVRNFYSISELRLKFVSPYIDTSTSKIEHNKNTSLRLNPEQNILSNSQFFIIYYSRLRHDVRYPSIEDTSSSIYPLIHPIYPLLNYTPLSRCVQNCLSNSPPRIRLELLRETCSKNVGKKKKWQKEGRRLGVGDIIPRAEVGKSTGCRRLSRLYRCLIGMGGRYEAG